MVPRALLLKHGQGWQRRPLLASHRQAYRDSQRASLNRGQQQGRRKEMQVMTLVCDMCPPTQKRKKTVTFALTGKPMRRSFAPVT